MKRIKISSKGFTLLELLVVVLIIGILAGIALPQYEKAVEKARVAEALLNIKAIEGVIQRYIWKNGHPSQTTYFDDFADIELSGGELDEESHTYYTKDFQYYPTCGHSSCNIEVLRINGDYAFYIQISADDIVHQCITQETDMGQYICKYLESQGWEYFDQEM